MLAGDVVGGYLGTMTGACFDLDPLAFFSTASGRVGSVPTPYMYQKDKRK